MSIILFFVFLIVYLYHKNKWLKILDSSIYTIWTIIELSKNAKSSDYYMYKYTYNNRSYKGDVGESSSNNLYVGKKIIYYFR